MNDDFQEKNQINFLSSHSGVILNNNKNSRSRWGNFTFAFNFISAIALIISLTIIMFKFGWFVQSGYYYFDGSLVQALMILIGFLSAIILIKIKDGSFVKLILVIASSLVMFVCSLLFIRLTYQTILNSPDADFIVGGQALEQGFFLFSLISSGAGVILAACYSQIFSNRGNKSVIFDSGNDSSLNSKDSMFRRSIRKLYYYFIGLNGILSKSPQTNDKLITTSGKNRNIIGLILLSTFVLTFILLFLGGYVSFLYMLWVILAISIVNSISSIGSLAIFMDLRKAMYENVSNTEREKSETANLQNNENLEAWGISKLNSSDISNFDISDFKMNNQKEKRPNNIVENIILIIATITLIIYYLYMIIAKIDNSYLPALSFLGYFFLVVIIHSIGIRIRKPKRAPNKNLKKNSKNLSTNESIEFYKYQKWFTGSSFLFTMLITLITAGVGLTYFENSDFKIITGQFSFMLIIAGVVGYISVLMHNNIKIKYQILFAIILLVIDIVLLNQALISNLNSKIYLTLQPYYGRYAHGIIHTLLSGIIFGICFGSVFSGIMDNHQIQMEHQTSGINQTKQISQKFSILSLFGIFLPIFGTMIGVTIGKDLYITGPHSTNYASQFNSIISTNTALIEVFAVFALIFFVILFVIFIVRKVRKDSKNDVKNHNNHEIITNQPEEGRE